MFVLALAGLALSAYSSYESTQASSQAASLSQAVGNYNAGLDETQANQIELDARQNAIDARTDNRTYLSRQKAAYAAAGVDVNTGSPLAVRAATAMRLERRVQQGWSDAEAKATELRSRAQAERMYGASAADQAHLQAVGTALGGAARLIGQGYSDYQSGMFSWGGEGG